MAEKAEIPKRQVVAHDLRQSGLSVKDIAEKLSLSERQTYRELDKCQSAIDNSSVIEQAQEDMVGLVPGAVRAYRAMIKPLSRDRLQASRDILTTHGIVRQRVDHSHTIEVKAIEEHRDRLKQAQELAAEDYSVDTVDSDASDAAAQQGIQQGQHSNAGDAGEAKPGGIREQVAKNNRFWGSDKAAQQGVNKAVQPDNVAGDVNNESETPSGGGVPPGRGSE